MRTTPESRRKVMEHKKAPGFDVPFLNLLTFVCFSLSAPILLKEREFSDTDIGLAMTCIVFSMYFGRKLLNNIVKDCELRDISCLVFVLNMFSCCFMYYAEGFIMIALSVITSLFMFPNEILLDYFAGIDLGGINTEKTGISIALASLVFAPVVNILSMNLVSNRSPHLVLAMFCVLCLLMLTKYDTQINKDNKKTSEVEVKKTEEEFRANMAKIFKAPGSLALFVLQQSSAIACFAVIWTLNIHLMNDYEINNYLNHLVIPITAILGVLSFAAAYEIIRFQFIFFNIINIATCLLVLSLKNLSITTIGIPIILATSMSCCKYGRRRGKPSLSDDVEKWYYNKTPTIVSHSFFILSPLIGSLVVSLFSFAGLIVVHGFISFAAVVIFICY